MAIEATLGSEMVEGQEAADNQAKAERLTRYHTGFKSFQELLDAIGYRPSMDMRDPELVWLADYYDASQAARGDEHRTYRYGTPAATQANKERRAAEAKPTPSPVPVRAPEKRMTLRGPGGLRLVLDPKDQATPVMVFSPFMKHSATYWCARDMGELLGSGEETLLLTQEQVKWLDAQEDLCDATERAARPEGWDRS